MSGTDADAAEALTWPSLLPVVTGMPQLCRAGLSENWLFKACGHRHWLALSAAYGLSSPDFRGTDGQRLYPAFTSIDLVAQGAGLGAVGENVRIDFALRLERIGRTRFRSTIAVSADGHPLAQLTMDSAFVHRAIAGANNSATRSGVALPCRLRLPAAHTTKPFRIHAWEMMLGFARTDRLVLASVTLDPVPHEDFNGADFLYFSAFQAMLDRAEWTWFRTTEGLPTSCRRSIFYLGNAELGDRIQLHLCGLREHGGASRDHWVEIQRESDGKLIGVAFSMRKMNADLR
ncbi:conserved hypothetical protein (plasmid) [Novosphingobium sp. PP1Y]|nr:conserved hypothetical protein [Novosphingobium sp. PP1Y]